MATISLSCNIFKNGILLVMTNFLYFCREIPIFRVGLLSDGFALNKLWVSEADNQVG
jgi:hypothetical protein